MSLINGDPVSLVVTAILVSIAMGIGNALGIAIYHALLEDRINMFLDKKHREKRLKEIKEHYRETGLFGNNGSSKIIDKMLK